MTETQFAAFLRSLVRTLSQEDVDRIEHEHDIHRPPFEVADHHEFGEAAH